MKGISERQEICRLVKIFLAANAVFGLTACVEEVGITAPAANAPDAVEEISSEPEVFTSTCLDGIDNDYDGWLDASDPDCFGSTDSEETGFGVSVCNNGIDDDGDSAIDSEDIDCQSATDETEALAPADILITEFMANPAATSDTTGEWFELYNNSGVDIDLNGWTIADAGGSHLIIESLVVPAGDYIVLSRAADDVNGLSPEAGTDYVYGTSLYFSNSGDEISVTNPEGILIDSMSYTSENVSAGASTLINSNTWCVSTLPITGGAGDLGSPGAENEVCP